jgi:parvulin-like peptidyl-prolyl isomerase
MMRKVLQVAAVLLTVILFLPDTTPAADSKGQVKTVALVNGVEITKEAVEIMMKRLGKEKGYGSELQENPGDLHKEALNQLILQELAYQKALSDGLTVEQKDVDNVIADIKKKLGDEGKYMELLDKEKISEAEFQKRVQRNLVLTRFFNIFKREINVKATVSEEELKNEYEKDKDKYTKPEKMVVVDVVFFLNPDDADSLKKAEEILEKIHTDTEKDPWNLVLNGTFIVRDLEMKDGSQEEEIYNQAKKINVGELSGVFLSSGTFHIIKLKEYTAFKQFTFEDVKNVIERKAKAEAQKKRLEEWEAELKKDARIEIMETEGNKSRQ